MRSIASPPKSPLSRYHPTSLDIDITRCHPASRAPHRGDAPGGDDSIAAFGGGSAGGAAGGGDPPSAGRHARWVDDEVFGVCFCYSPREFAWSWSSGRWVEVSDFPYISRCSRAHYGAGRYHQGFG